MEKYQPLPPSTNPFIRDYMDPETIEWLRQWVGPWEYQAQPPPLQMPQPQMPPQQVPDESMMQYFSPFGLGGMPFRFG